MIWRGIQWSHASERASDYIANLRRRHEWLQLPVVVDGRRFCHLGGPRVRHDPSIYLRSSSTQQRQLFSLTWGLRGIGRNRNAPAGLLQPERRTSRTSTFPNFMHLQKRWTWNMDVCRLGMRDAATSRISRSFPLFLTSLFFINLPAAALLGCIVSTQCVDAALCCTRSTHGRS